MASSGKRKTTMAKLNREAKLRDKRHEKVMRKNARKRAAAEGTEAQPGEGWPAETDQATLPEPDPAAPPVP